MKLPILTTEIRFEHDVVHARQQARLISQQLQFDHQEQIRIATAVSELARNAYQYAGGGRVEFSLKNLADAPGGQAFMVRVSDQGPGISSIEEIFGGGYVSPTGMGKGLLGARRLMDACEVISGPGEGTTVTLLKHIKATRAFTPIQVGEISTALINKAPSNPFQEVQKQNQELLQLMEALKNKEMELTHANECLAITNQELEETNRGVLALYVELDEKASALKLASELKGRFLSYMSHEFRTPVNSIAGLSAMLLSHLDGELSLEQEKQVTFIQRSAEAILEMVNDLLDLSKAESGKIEVHPGDFFIEDIFGALKGMMRPLVDPNQVDLEFSGAETIPKVHSDEGKLSQILRNLVSNALKFTEKGSVRVRAELSGDQLLTITVVDTGIGIPQAELGRIFEEYSQVDSPMQRKHKGTGLGLSLVKKFTELLGGTISVESRQGQGSLFTLKLPVIFFSAAPQENYAPVVGHTEARAKQLLIIDDDEISRYLLRNLLTGQGFEIEEASNPGEGLSKAILSRPDLIVLDYLMPQMNAPEVLRALGANSATKKIPVIVRTSFALSERERSEISGLVVDIVSKELIDGEKAFADLQVGIQKALKMQGSNE